MNPIAHPNCTRRLGKPANWDDATMGTCDTLPVSLEVFERVQFICSFWKPTPQELAVLNSGASVKLGIATLSHPVVFVGVEV